MIQSLKKLLSLFMIAIIISGFFPMEILKAVEIEEVELSKNIALDTTDFWTIVWNPENIIHTPPGYLVGPKKNFPDINSGFAFQWNGKVENSLAQDISVADFSTEDEYELQYDALYYYNRGNDVNIRVMVGDKEVDSYMFTSLEYGKKTSKKYAIPASEIGNSWNFQIKFIFNPNDSSGAQVQDLYIDNISLKRKTTKYNVTFTGEGINIPAQKVNKWRRASEPTNPQREGFFFAGWQKDWSNYDFSNPVTEDTNLVAKWAKKQLDVVFYNSDNSVLLTQKVDFGNSVTDPTITPVVPDGYDFVGWKRKWDIDDNIFVFNNVKITEKIELIPIYKKRLKVTFFQQKDDNPLGELSSKTVSYNSLVNASGINLGNTDGYDFLGWFAEWENTVFDFAKTKIDKDIKIIAKFSKKSLTVNFQNENGVALPNSPKRVLFWEKVTKENPTKDGRFEFVGWEVVAGSNIGKIFNIITETIKENLTLKARFREISAPKVIISEVAYRLDDKVKDWVELYNPTDSEIDISGFILKDDTSKNDAHSLLEFPENTKIPPKTYITFANEDFSGFYGVSPTVIKQTTGNLNLWHTEDKWKVYFVELYDKYGKIDGVSWTRNGKLESVTSGNISSKKTGNDNQNICRIGDNWHNDCQQTPNSENNQNEPAIILSQNEVNHNISGVEIGDLSVINTNGIDTDFEYNFATTTAAKYSNDLFEIRDKKLFLKNTHTTDFFAKNSYKILLSAVGNRGALRYRQELTINVIEPKYSVNYIFKSATTGQELPQEIKTRIPEAHTNVIKWQKVTPKEFDKTEFADTNLDGKWTFTSITPEDGITMDAANAQFEVVWTFTPNTRGAGGAGGGGGGWASPVVTPTIKTENPLTPTITKPQHNALQQLLPTQTKVVEIGKTKTGEKIFRLQKRITDYICEDIVQPYSYNQVAFTDNPDSFAFHDDISALAMFRGLEKDEMNLGQTYKDYAKYGVVNNVKNFEPNRNVTRAEFVKMIVRSLSCRYTFVGTDSGFSDVPANEWHAEYIKFAVENGWINGYEDGKFRPNAPITRAEAAKILSRSIKLQFPREIYNSYKDVSDSSEFLPYIEALKNHGIMKWRNVNTFAPNANIPRTETSRIIYRTFFGGNN